MKKISDSYEILTPLYVTHLIFIQSEERYRLLADNATDTIWIVQLPDLKLRYVSPSMEYLLGYTPSGFLGKISAVEFIELVISDTGCGIHKKYLDRIFEPFFTTKGRGDGTGMGLATVYGIIKEMGGVISVYSEIGLGTTFRILLPEHDQIEPSEEKYLDAGLTNMVMKPMTAGELSLTIEKAMNTKKE